MLEVVVEACWCCVGGGGTCVCVCVYERVGAREGASLAHKRPGSEVVRPGGCGVGWAGEDERLRVGACSWHKAVRSRALRRRRRVRRHQSRSIYAVKRFNPVAEATTFYLPRVPIIRQAASGTGFRMRRLPISHPCCICHDDQKVPGSDQKATWGVYLPTPVFSTANPTTACQGLAVLMPSKCWRPVESQGTWSNPRHFD
ncbi:hypothetical protein GWK47_007048 [Chionoecetes opilio]|uniref:Uncharacterized protein n=1 Tax=Chionoecetes opilio TaxID=41210 RepID=A0A8J4Y246_CHIOP|nr:hypothetical protein GWK47_007048 [Chionoecetes opilio]